jgi:atypical dual specificity phosphatase
MVLVLSAVGCVEVGPARVEPAGGPAWVVSSAAVPLDTADPATGAETTSEEVYEMHGFSFVDDKVAGMPQPGSRAPLADDLSFLADQDITLLVSLTINPTPVDTSGLALLHLPIEDFHPPTLDQQHALVEALQARVRAGERVGIHCTAGLGRTGTMLATWFVARGLDPAQAIDRVRALRPGSIETTDQEESVFLFAEAIR